MDNPTENKHKKKKKKSIGKKIGISIGVLALTGIVSAGGLAGYIYLKNQDTIKSYINSGYEKVANIQSDTFNSRYTTQVLDTNGNLVKEFKLIDYDYENYKDINPKVFEAFIAIEDRRYYEHNGVDYQGLLRAGVKLVTSRGEVVQGGSTITQQLVKNVFLTMEQTVWRKLEEMVIAQELEKIYSKEEIIEFYVNNINYGNGAYSIESASQYYYSKNTKELTLSEIATLVAIPNSPTYYDPIINPENNKERRNAILNAMFEEGYITENELNEALSQDIILNIKHLDIDNSITDYDLDYAIDKAVEELMYLNGFQFRYNFKSDKDRNDYYERYSEKYKEAREELITGGYTIETSINPEVQNKLQEVVDNNMAEFTAINSENGLYMKQSASTVIDNTSGEVIAIVGGRSQEGNTFNRANLGYRQPGSSIKPLVSYLPYFEQGGSPDDKMEDSYIANGPVNWYSGYKGVVSLRYATELSINTIPYRITASIGADKALDYLTNMKFMYIMPEDNSPVIAVGGFTKGVTTTEMAGAYSGLSRNGSFIKPTNVRKITKRSNNKTIYENTHKATQIYSEGASYLMTETLKGVLNNPNGTGYRARILNYTNQAGKTGSTDDYKDAWIAGYTKHYTMTVWVGDDIPAPQYGNAMSATPKYIWHDMMTYLHQGLEDTEFTKPDSVYTDSTGALRTTVSEKNKEQKERSEKEEIRKLNETKAQQERIGEEEYRIVYGLSEDEENRRELVAESKIKTLSNYKLTSLSQEDELRQLIYEAQSSLDSVKRKSAYNKLSSNLDSIISTLNTKLDSLYQAKYKEEEALRKQQEEEEKKRLEEEQKKLEEERKKLEEEQKRLEEEQKKEEANQNANSNNTNSDTNNVDDINESTSNKLEQSINEENE